MGIKYYIVIGKSKSVLETSVNEYLEAGCELRGGVAIGPNGFLYQAVTYSQPKSKKSRSTGK